MDWIGFSLAVLLIELTPGPNMGWLAALSATDGKRSGLSATAGVALGLALNGILSALGLTALLNNIPSIWSWLNYAGALMMLWLAWEAWRGGESAVAKTPSMAYNSARYALAGLLMNLFNPKAFLFYLMVAPQFLNDGTTISLSQALVLTGISVTIATLIHLGIVLAGVRASTWVSSPQRTRLVRRIMAVFLFGVAIWFTVSGHG